MERKQLKSLALEQLKGKKKPFVLALLAFIAIELVLIGPFYISLFLHGDFESPSAGFISSFIVEYLVILAFLAVVLPLFSMTFIKAIVKAAEQPASEPFTSKSFWSCFKGSGCGIGNFWWTYLWMYLWALLCISPILIVAIVLAVTGHFESDSGTILLPLIIFVFYIVTFVVVINRELAYSMNWFILAKHREVGIIEAMNISKKITKGHLWELFVLDLSFLGWYLLCMLTCGILLFWYVPYYTMTQYNAFNYLFGKINPNEIEHNEYSSEDPYFAKDMAPAEKPESEE